MNNGMSKEFITPKTAISSLAKSLSIGLVPMLWGSPGIGKTASVKEIARQLNFFPIIIITSLHESIDFAGLPSIDKEAGKCTYLPFDKIPLESDPIPEGYDGFLIFFDEINHGREETTSAIYQVLLEKELAGQKIHPQCYMIAAGNYEDDRAMVNKMSTATKSRLTNLYMKCNLDEWIEDVAAPQGYDFRIISFLSEFPSNFYNFAPEENQDSFCCPRSWSSVAKLMKVSGNTLTKDDLPVVGGILSPDVATKFISYLSIIDDIVTYEQVMKNPETAPIPTKISLKWATISSLAEKTTADNVEKLLEYLKRDEMDRTFLVLYMRLILARDPSLRREKAVTEATVMIGKYFSGK